MRVNLLRYRPIAIATVMTAVIFSFVLFANLTVLGGGTGVSLMNSGAITAALAFAAIQAYWSWKTAENRAEANQIWGLLTIALGLDMLANAIWTVYLMIMEEVPYPSIADLVWVGAMICYFFSLLNRYRKLEVRPSGRQIVIAQTVLGVILLVVFLIVLYPIVTDTEPGRLLEKILNVYYPVTDFAVLSIALLVVLTFFGGRISLTWILIACGALSMAIGDITYTYAEWNGLYFPEGQPNFISLFSDLLFVLAALLFGFGAFIHRFLLRVEDGQLQFRFATASPSQSQPVNVDISDLAFERAAIFTNANYQVIYTGESLRNLLKAQGISGSAVGRPLGEVFGLDAPTVEHLMQQVVQQGIINRTIELQLAGMRLPVTMLAAKRQDAQHRFEGVDIFLTLNRGALESQAPQPHVETTHPLLQQLLARAAATPGLKPEEQKALAYFIVKVTELYLFLTRMAGLRAGRALSEVFNSLAQKQGYLLRMRDGNVEYDYPPSAPAMQCLLKGVVQYTQNMTSPSAIWLFLKHLDETLPGDILEAARRYGLEGDLARY